MNTPLFAVSAFTASLLILSSAKAVSIVNDTFRDDTHTDPGTPVYAENDGAVGVDADSDTNLESAWFQGSSTLTVAATGTEGDDQLLQFAPTGIGSFSATTYFTPEATPVTLANPGDQLVITWKFIPRTSVSTTTGQNNFRTAIVNSPDAVRGSGSPPSAIYAGYGVWWSPSDTLPASPVRIQERVDNTVASAFLSASASWAAVGTNTGTAGATGFAIDTTYTFTFSATRTEAGELDLFTSIVGGTLNNTGTVSASFLDPTPNSFTFDTFGMRPSTAAGSLPQFDTSLFEVQVILVPEPSALISLLGGVGMLLGRRRIRR